MEAIVNWLVEMNKTNHIGFAIATVAIMAGVGFGLGSIIELFFKALGIKSDKIEIHH